MKRHYPLIVFILAIISGQIHAQTIWKQITIPEPKIQNIQASPNGKLFLSGTQYLYESTNEGDSWTQIGPSATFKIDSQGMFLSVKGNALSYSMDEGKSWQSNVFPTNLSPQEYFAVRDSLYLFVGNTYPPRVYSTSDLGKTVQLSGTFPDGGSFGWQTAYQSPLGNLFGVQLYCGCLFMVNAGGQESDVRLSMSSCWADNSPPLDVCFDYSGYGYACQLCNLLRSSDNGRTWIPIDSGQNSLRFWPPYLPLLNNSLIAVTDTVTMWSKDHADTWQKIGDGIPRLKERYNTSFVDRRNFAFAVFDSALFRMSVYASAPSVLPTNEDIIVQHDPVLDRISIRSKTPLGITTASLYTIDGRLLQQEKFNIAPSEKHTIDLANLHTHFLILILQTNKRVITKKIVLVQ
ncbi:MAG: hypothetical protein Q8916_09805 [Bacteroidota bacterium]|nr:hypothetical protein [Bacteroidota bacterium]MDP4230681.1 hypothetical protein [Bacteroidota bacterium]MDP4235090.1 hypothetical protein [Bacteroidota bacterium]